MKIFVVFVLLLYACGCSVLQKSNAFTIDPASFLLTLDPGHPRMMMKDKDLGNLKKQYETDEALKKYAADVLAEADKDMGKPMLQYKKIGPRLLSVSRECLNRIYALGFAYRWTGDEKYAARARENLLAVCGFPDWNPSHFLDTAEMSHAVGIGYDWLFHYLDEKTKEKIKAGLIKHGMIPGCKAYTEKEAWWVKSEFNWNQVCNSGLTIGALAIAETDPEYARIVVPNAVKSLPLALSSYAPDGVWMEGPGYWHYATRYTAYGLCALETALGTDFGLSAIEGLSVTGLFPIYTTGPTGLYLNYADSGEKSRRGAMPCQFWLARTYKNSLLADAEHDVLQSRKAEPEHLMWYVPRSGIKSAPRDLDRYFKSRVAIAVFRSGWDDPEALFVGVKAGYNTVNHGHLDLGNFEMDALGVRWARDLGSEDYNLPGYWDGKKDGKRWDYYRLRSFSHNIPLLGGKDQDVEGVARFVKTGEASSRSFVVVDLTSAYGEFAKKAMRGVALVGDRKAVLVRDEFTLKKPCEIVWGMTTDAEIALQKGGRAELSLEGKKLIARVLSPEGGDFEIESSEQKPPEKQNKGVKRLLVRLPARGDKTEVAVLLSPVWKDDQSVSSVELKPLKQW